MSDFGEKLRRQRESRNITLREISDSTKINKRYLEALERNEFDALPGGVFVKGYIRTFAEAIGMNPEPLLEDYRTELRARGEGDPLEDEQVAKEAAQAALSQLARSLDRPRRPILLPLLIGCGILAIVTWTAIHYLTARPAQSPIVEPPAPEIVAPIIQPVVAATPPAVVPDPPALEPEVVTAEPAPPAGTIAITEFGVGSGVENRQLVGRGEAFREGSTVWFWTRVVGGSRGDGIQHIWLHEGEQVGAIELEIGGSHWRTQSRWSLRAGSAGRWSVEARDAGGRLLARSEFNCLPAD
jgi:transcriptional regulator with XRE-family HTH domain